MLPVWLTPEPKCQKRRKKTERNQNPNPFQSVSSLFEARISKTNTTGAVRPLPHLSNEIELTHLLHIGDLGINVLKEYQGKGYGTEAIKWAMNWSFRRANMHRVGIGAFGWNTKAIRLYEKLGFVHEARRRDFLWHDGEYHDIIEMAILEDEWRDLYGTKK